MSASLAKRLEAELPGAVQDAKGQACFLPRNASEMGLALRIARELSGRLRPPGGAARPDDVIVDLRRLGSVVAHDDTSLLVHVQAGVHLATLEEELRRRRLTLAVPAAPPEIDVGTWLARGAPGARSKADDPVDQLVAGIEAILPDESKLKLRPAPRRAVGPDLATTMVGARGRLGVITAAHLVVQRTSDAERVAYRFPNEDSARTALAWIRGRGARPANVRVIETEGGWSLELDVSGPTRLRAIRLELVSRIAREHDGAEIDAKPVTAVDEYPAIAPIVEELAAALDPTGVLG